jgi:hypothetical protein
MTRTTQASKQVHPLAGTPTVCGVGGSDFEAEWNRLFVQSVRNATQRAFERAAYLPAHEAFVVLAEELTARGIEPEPAAVYEGAPLISRGRKPAVLRA